MFASARVIRPALDSIISDGDLAGQTQKLAWLPPWHDGGNGWSWPVEGRGSLFLNQAARKAWCYNLVGAAQLNHNYKASVDLDAFCLGPGVKIKTWVSLATGNGPDDWVVIASSSPATAAPGEPVSARTMSCVYVSTGPDDPNLRNNLYLIVRAEAEGSPTADFGGGPLGGGHFRNCVVVKSGIPQSAKSGDQPRGRVGVGR